MHASGLFIATVASVVLCCGCSSKQSAGTGPVGTARNSGGTPAASVARGKQIFMQNCATCHGTRAEGGVGPSLRNERAKKDLGKAEAWIKNPRPPMPKLYPGTLSDKDVLDVASYVETL